VPAAATPPAPLTPLLVPLLPAEPGAAVGLLQLEPARIWHRALVLKPTANARCFFLPRTSLRNVDIKLP